MTLPSHIARIRQLAEGATPGPWFYWDHSDNDLIATGKEEGQLICALAGITSRPKDFAFIAASRTLLPALADALEEAQKDADVAWNALQFDDISLAERILSRLPVRLCAILDSAFAEKPETKGGDETCATQAGKASRLSETSAPAEIPSASSITVASPAPRQSDPDVRGADIITKIHMQAEHHLATAIAPGHNPDRLTVAQVGEGWRLLDEDEVGSNIPEHVVKEHIQKWLGESWGAFVSSWFPFVTYRTQLTRAELRTARGLDSLTGAGAQNAKAEERP